MVSSVLDDLNPWRLIFIALKLLTLSCELFFSMLSLSPWFLSLFRLLVAPRWAPMLLCLWLVGGDAALALLDSACTLAAPLFRLPSSVASCRSAGVRKSAMLQYLWPDYTEIFRKFSSNVVEKNGSLEVLSKFKFVAYFFPPKCPKPGNRYSAIFY